MAATTPRVLLLSTGTGAEGLTLTAASRVVLLDVSWNPSADAQAAARVYRYGQTRRVHIYRFVADDTVDALLAVQAARKSRLARWVIDDDHAAPALGASASLGRAAIVGAWTAAAARHAADAATDLDDVRDGLPDDEPGAVADPDGLLPTDAYLRVLARRDRKSVV